MSEASRSEFAEDAGTAAGDQASGAPQPGPGLDGAASPHGDPLGASTPHGDPLTPSTPGETGAAASGSPADGDEARGNDSLTVAVEDDLLRARADLLTLTRDLQRLQAEYLNYKRRVDRDRELVKENARFAVLSGLLPVLDDIDRARSHGELEGGFKAIAEAFERAVGGLGLDKFGTPGDEFDPFLHEALMHGHSPEVTRTTCADIVQAGYRIGDRVVRAAKVTVVDPESESAGLADSTTD